MLYSDVQARIAERLDNRSDLSNIIYQYSQGRIQYWSGYFFYSSDIVDTSLLTTPGQIFYNLPSGIRNLRRLRLLIGNNLTGLQIGFTTTTAQVTLPTATIPVASTTGFAATAGVVSVGGMQVFYKSVDATDFLQCVGVTPNDVQGVVPAGAQVYQLSGVWLDMVKVSYDQIVNEDVLSPSLASLPYEYGQFNTQFRLYPVASATFPLECTGNGAPAPPLNDTDDNFWTEDAAWLIIASTANEIRRGYLHVEDVQQDLVLENLERKRLMKLSGDLMDNLQIRSWL